MKRQNPETYECIVCGGDVKRMEGKREFKDKLVPWFECSNAKCRTSYIADKGQWYQIQHQAIPIDPLKIKGR